MRRLLSLRSVSLAVAAVARAGLSAPAEVDILVEIFSGEL